VPFPEVPTGVDLYLGVPEVAKAERSPPEDLFKGIAVRKWTRVVNIDVVHRRGDEELTLGNFGVFTGNSNKETVLDDIAPPPGVLTLFSQVLWRELSH